MGFDQILVLQMNRIESRFQVANALQIRGQRENSIANVLYI